MSRKRRTVLANPDRAAGSTVGENLEETMEQIWRRALGKLLLDLDALFTEPQFANEAFRNTVRLNRGSFSELFSGAETVGLSKEAGKRERYIIELTALATFVSTFNKMSGAHIFELASKLSDLNKGQDDPLFEPAKVGDRHRDRSVRWRARARITLAVEARIRSRVAPKDAEAEVARLMGNRIFEFAGKRAAKSKPVSILRNWRKAFNNDRVPDLEGQELFKNGVAKIDKAISEGNAAAIEDIVQNVAHAAALGGVLSPT
jgi:hypothetical protein